MSSCSSVAIKFVSRCLLTKSGCAGAHLYRLRSQFLFPDTPKKSLRRQHPGCLPGSTNKTEVLQDRPARLPSFAGKVVTTPTLGFLSACGHESAIEALMPLGRTDAASK